jgi:hypothetical protein
MKANIVKVFGYLGITAIIALVAAATFLVFRAGFSNISKTNDFISAFAGAFFAFVFVKLAELGTRLYKRQRINQEALVTLEQEMQDYINRLYGNDFVADDIIKTIAATVAKPAETPKVNFNFLKPLPIDRTTLLSLRNIDYKNDVFNFYADLDKLNGSLSSIQRYYDLLTTSLMSGQLNKTDYIENLKIISEKMTEIKKFIAASIDDCLDVATKTRLLLKETPVLLITAIQLKPQNYTDSFKAKIKAERKVAQKEMDENTKDSLARIKKIIAP